MIKRILIGIDDSKYADHAAKYGFNLAEMLQAHVGLVHINEPMAIPISNGSADSILGTPMQGLSGIDDVDMLNAQTQLSENIIERTAKRYGGKLEVTQFNEYGSTADGIISCAKEFEADMIIIGTHSRSGLDRLLMGSVAENVVRNSEIPVLVVPSKE
jgi:nucleotide-binding universal stress UspA family protein